MVAFIITTIVCFITYLLLTTGSGTDVWIWSYEEIIFGLVLSILVGIVGRNVFVNKKNLRLLNPARWFIFLGYVVGPFFVSMAKANLDVAYRVIHPRMPIKPGIVVIKTNLKQNIAKLILANSITLTPGTFTLDIKEDKLLIHWIDVKSSELKEASRIVGERFEKILRKIFN